MSRLLLVAPACDGEDVGEAWVTFQWVRRLVRRHDTTVLTFMPAGATPLAEQLGAGRVVTWREPDFGHERLGAMLKPGYPLFYAGVRRWLSQASRRGQRFDIAHQLSPVALRYPSPLAGGTIPFVIGPCGGSLPSPPPFVHEEAGSPWYTRLRQLDEFRLRHDPMLRRTFADADHVLGIADYVRTPLSTIPLKAFSVVGDTGVERLPESAPGSSRTKDVRLLFVGRIIRTKGVRDAIRALSLLPAGTARLDIVGEGNDRNCCERLVRSLGLEASVTFHGRVRHADIPHFYRSADIFLFPSYREAGGIVVAEAMSYGLPVVVADRGGPAGTVSAGTGIRVSPADPRQYAEDLAHAVRRLAADPGLRSELGAAARARVADVGLWDRKVDGLEQIYADVLARRRTTSA